MSEIDPAVPRAKVTEPAWPTLAACLAPTPEGPEGGVAPSQACLNVDFKNTLSPIFVLKGLEIEVDGELVFARHEPPDRRGDLAATKEFTVLLDRAAPGSHALRLVAWLGPDATVQPSLKGYRWSLCSVHLFTLAARGGLFLETILYEKRAGARPPEEWPAARYLENGETPPPAEGPERVPPHLGKCP